MNQQTLDDSYNNSKAVPESKQLFDHWVEQSRELRAAHPEHLDIAYGPSAREKLDYFSAGANTPVVIFIHGGFWQMRSKNDFSFLAASYLKEGISVAMVGYPLAPQATIDEIVASSQKAVSFIGQHIASWGGNPNEVILTGWSSGGHLTATSMHATKLKAVIPISGIFELEPLLGTYINKNLRMDIEDALRNSPILHLPHSATAGAYSAAVPIYVFVGGSELSEMRRQSHDYAAKLKSTNYPVWFQEIPSKNHYTILEQFNDPQGAIHQRIISLLK